MWIKPDFLSKDEIKKILGEEDGANCGPDGVYCPPGTGWPCSNCPDNEYTYN